MTTSSCCTFLFRTVSRLLLHRELQVLKKRQKSPKLHGWLKGPMNGQLSSYLPALWHWMGLVSVSTFLSNHHGQVSISGFGLFEQGHLLRGLFKTWQHIFQSLLCFFLFILGWFFVCLFLCSHHAHDDHLRPVFQHFHLPFSFTVLSAVLVNLVLSSHLMEVGRL